MRLGLHKKGELDQGVRRGLCRPLLPKLSVALGAADPRGGSWRFPRAALCSSPCGKASPTSSSTSRYTAGVDEGTSAYRQAMNAGQPAGSPIYFAVDFDASLAGIAGAMATTTSGVSPTASTRSARIIPPTSVGRLWLRQHLRMAARTPTRQLHLALPSPGAGADSQTFTKWNIKQGPVKTKPFDLDPDNSTSDHGGFVVASIPPRPNCPRSPPGSAFTRRSDTGYCCSDENLCSLMMAGWRCSSPRPHRAIVGGGVPSTRAIGRSVVTIVGSRGNFCTGALIAPKLALTGGALRAAGGGPTRSSKLAPTGSRNYGASKTSRSTLPSTYRRCQRIAPPPTSHCCNSKRSPNGKNPAALGVPQVPIAVGSRFTIAGIGVTIRGEGTSGGTIRCGQPGRDRAARGPCRSGWSIRRAGRHTRRARRLHRGFRRAGVRGPARAAAAIVGVVSWSTGPNGSAGLWRPDRRYAAHALSRLDFTDREGMGVCVVSSAGLIHATIVLYRPATTITPCRLQAMLSPLAANKKRPDCLMNATSPNLYVP